MKTISPKMFARLIVLSSITLAVSAAQPQMPPRTPTPLDDNPGKDCLDYRLDVRGLNGGTHKMFWKQDDCVRLYITNNPFVFQYTLKFNEVPIKEDDPLSSFGGKFGLNVSNVSSTGSAGSSHGLSSDQKSETALAEERNRNIAADLAEAVGDLKTSDVTSKYSLMIDAGTIASLSPSRSSDETRKTVIERARNTVNKLGDKKEGLQADDIKRANRDLDDLKTVGAPNPLPGGFSLTTLQDEDERIQRMMALITDEYRQFTGKVQGRLRVLRSPATLLDKVESVATKLRNDSNQEIDCLSAANFDPGYTKLQGCPENIDSDPSAANSTVLAPTNMGCLDPSTHSLICELLEFAHKVQPLHLQIEGALPAASPATSSDDADSSPVGLMNKLHGAAQDVASEACKYQAFTDSDINSISTGLIAPLNSVLSDGLSFGYEWPNAALQREGPFVDPTSVTMSLHRDPVTPFTGKDGTSNLLQYTTDSYTCAGDPGDLVTNGSSYRQLADFFSDKLAKLPTGSAAAGSTDTANLYMRNQNKPVFKGKTTSPAPDAATDPTSAKTGGSTKPSGSDATKPATLTQPWLFGKPRLVLSGGVGTALLSKQEFQRSTSINGSATQTVIGLKTNTKIRTAPMLYGHTYLPWFNTRHDPDGFYATFGVTANSDNKGTDPEFLFGLSRSFIQQRFFLTAGAYLGERQKLDGGLYVGEVIPTSFTTDLPVTKSYHAGFGFGISYRFTSTKTAQDNKATSTSSGKTGN